MFNFNFVRMKKETKEEPKMVKVIGLEVRPTKPQHLVVGRTYEVNEDTAKLLVKSKQAKLEGSKEETKEPKGDK